MSNLYAMAAVADDRMNAVAVREFRQAVQSRWVVGMLTLFLGVNLCVIGGVLVLSPGVEQSITAGRDVFLTLFGILQVTCIWFVPIYSAARLVFERKGDNVDLLYISTLTPGAIVRGKYLASMGLTLLIFSTCLPFLTMTYLLRGIDLPTIFTALFIGFFICALGNAVGIMVGSISGSVFIRGIIDVAAIIYLLYSTVILLSVCTTVSRGFGWRAFGFGQSFALYGFLSWILSIGLFYVVAVALLSPKPANKMLIPRIYITACWAVLGGIAITVGNTDGVIGWVVLSTFAFVVLTVISLGERESWSSRVRRNIPRGLLPRASAFIFYSGSAGGMLWCTLLFAATILIAGNVPGWSHGSSTELLANCAITFGYVLCYCLTIAAFRPLLFRKLPTPSLSVVAAFLGTALSVGPYLIAFLLSPNPDNVVQTYLIGSPLILSTSNAAAAKDTAGFAVLIWFAVSLLLSAPWALGQWQRFKPISQ